MGWLVLMRFESRHVFVVGSSLQRLLYYSKWSTACVTFSPQAAFEDADWLMASFIQHRFPQGNRDKWELLCSADS